MITLDLETQSYADLKRVGAWAYSEDLTTEVICVCWGYEREPIEEWWPGQPPPFTLFSKIWRGIPVEAHNVAFERSIWTNILTPRYGWPLPADDQWRDTMAIACYYALPAALDKLARVLDFEGKDPDGQRLITKYSKLHLKKAKKEIPPDDFRRFVEYCRRDVRIEQSVSDFLGDLPEREQPVFALDQRTNFRGLYLDARGIAAASQCVDLRSEALVGEFERLTGYKPTQRDRVLEWFNEHGLGLENLQAEYLDELLEDGDLPQGPARHALEIRVEVNKASTKKLDAMARARGKDGRARFQTRYHGAVTGRNTGQGLQPLNLNRGFTQEDVEPWRLVEDIMYGDPAWLDLVYGDAMDAISKATRHWIMAENGNKLIAGDFVSIEAVVLACLAGETWKVEAFRQGVKLYELMADKIYRLPPGTVTKATHPIERQDGKTGELAFGYQGALGAWLKFDRSGRHSDERIIEICKAWRAEHPSIVKFWYGLNDAAMEAVREPGYAVTEGSIGFEMVNDWLSMILPDGKRIWYWKPELRVGMPKWHKPTSDPDCAAGTCRHEPQPYLTYMAQKTGKWGRVATYGGKLCENATQATSRQLLVPATMAVEKAGYPPILTVYDEIVAEVPESFGSPAEFEQIALEAVQGLWWAKDWPIRIEAWAGNRYRK